MADEDEAFPTLGDAELARLVALGVRRPIAPGEFLYRSGDATYDFHLLLSGAVDIVIDTDDGEQVVARHGAGRFLGELNLLTGLRVFVSARVAEAGEAVVVPRDVLRRVIATDPGLGDVILTAFLARRTVLLRGAGSSLRVIGSRFSPDSLRIREYLARSRIPHEWLDPDHDDAVEVALREVGVTPADLPVVIATGSVLRRATPGAVAEYLGLTVSNLPERCYDVIVVGGGPAGLAAAVYGASEGLGTLGVEMTAVGGQAGSTSRIENYLGFPTGISGGDLTQRAFVQAEKFGAHMANPCTVSGMREEAGHLVLRLSDGTDVVGRAVIAATGARYRRLDAERLEDFEDTGVFYAATETEARICGAVPAVVVGGGNSAGQAAMFLAGSCSAVTLVHRGSDLTKSMSRYLTDRIESHPDVVVRTGTVVTRLEGEQSLSAVHVKGPGGDEVLPCGALFSFIGAEPSSQWLSGCAELDGRGFVLTDRSLDEEHLDGRWEALGRRPLPFETSHPGLFAVGDVRSGSTKRVAAAVGEGSAAVRSVFEHLSFAH